MGTSKEPLDGVVITHEVRIEVLEGIAKSYLSELMDALQQAKIVQLTGTLRPNETPTTLDIRVRDLEVRVDSLTHKLERVDALPNHQLDTI